jgi:predicted phage-related endonuclease
MLVDYEEEVKMHYREELLTKKEQSAQDASLDMSYAGWVIDVPNIAAMENEEYAKARRYGFGGSDASILLGVNPYKTIQELIQEKARDELTAEEKAVGEKVAVKKGRDLEPLIIKKFEEAFGLKTWKPIDMYKCLEFPYLKMNFDGVTGEPGAYIPAEIKVITAKGERHYNPTKAIYTEGKGMQPYPENVSQHNISIQTKAAHYGIPPYYYTQLQQEIMASGAPYGYLSALYDKDWIMRTYFVWRDDNVIKDIILQGHKRWQEVVALNPERAI